ncbi:hypothetical protein G5576_005620 [Homo sapiens]|uniref:Uncharacterized protein n=1 Tax=Homo sapiens TaxID=9606 RepID=A0A286YF13_HUMAN|nr:hypothetical protein KI723_110786 [Homo sapiens]KAI4071242.1 hypothetical protein G5576_005620 [Homo sapiens]
MLNFTDVTEFILLGLTSRREWQVLFFIIFLVVYIITMVGNIGMMVLIKATQTWPILRQCLISRM